MDWSARINSAIEYIEKNLDGEVNINEVAKKACFSPFHFQRMFFAIVGITPTEYIRRRRLTVAATELATGTTKVTDIALKYGYESPNAFTRAFRNMHGINPREARTSGANLSAYQRVSVHVEIKGGSNMDYKIIERPAFDVLGRSKRFTYDEFLKNGSKLWKEYVSTEEYLTLWKENQGRCGPVSGTPLMSIYLPENGSRDSFVDILGVEKMTERDSKQFETFQIPAATYAEFNCTYQTSMKVNKYIYGEWFSSTGYERDETKPDIAAYFPVVFRSLREMGVRWWIPIIKKD